MPFSRREFLSRTASVSTAFAGLGLLGSRLLAGEAPTPRPGRWGPLLNDPHRILDLPKGFSYRVISRVGDPMSDGLLTPAKPDGMAAFPGPDHRVILLRNHEIVRDEGPGAFGAKNELLDRVDRDKLYDPGTRFPPRGGVTTLVYNPSTGEVERSGLSLAGTCYNCAGGPTPWGSWLTCEEDVTKAGGEFARDHGYVFEVPASATPSLVRAAPIKAMGRFRHEAVCIDPRSGVVYLTEDRDDSLLYRFIPTDPRDLHKGGTLQALRVRGRASADLRNWERVAVRPGDKLDAEWMDLDAIDAPEDDLRTRGFAAGAARFARNEGTWWGGDAAYIASTSGGKAQHGQIWRYRPGPAEATPMESKAPGSLELLAESPGRETMNMCDNITVAPFGDLFICEDGSGPNRVLHFTKEGEVFEFARNALSGSEFAGGCFSPDATTFFANIQGAGLTLAITGPWRA
jgi:secreted PhoX family phosphatase